MDRRARALEELYRRRYVGFRNALATLTGSYDSARDAVQEAFARALRERASLRDDAALEAWVWRIAVRAALDAHRNGREVSSAGLPDPAVLEPERNPVLADVLRTLPPRKRLIVFLRYFADLSYTQIAETCGISEGTVAASLAQARDVITTALGRDRDEQPGE